MGKASRSKQLKRQEAEVLKLYSGIKLSEALLTICEPYLIADMTEKRYNKLISFGVAAWNIAILPESLRQQAFLKVARRITETEIIPEAKLILILTHKLPDDASDAVVMLQVLSGMIRRKLEIYPNDNRVVMDFWFESKSGKDVLQVKSMIPNVTKA